MQLFDPDGPFPDLGDAQRAAFVLMRIGIALQDDDEAAIASTLSLASALARTDPRLELVVATANARIADHVRRHDDSGEPWLDLVELPRPRFAGRLRHGPRQIYIENLAFFASLDVLLTSDVHARTLTAHHGLGLQIIFANPVDAPPDRHLLALLVGEDVAPDGCPARTTLTGPI